VIISNSFQVAGSYWLDISWDNGQVKRARTGDVDLEDAGAQNNVSIPPGPLALGNAVEEVD
jgi:hypothetical protein